MNKNYYENIEGEYTISMQPHALDWSRKIHNGNPVFQQYELFVVAPTWVFSWTILLRLSAGRASYL